MYEKNEAATMFIHGVSPKYHCEQNCVFNDKMSCLFTPEQGCKFKHVESAFTTEEMLRLNEGWDRKAIVRSLTEPALRYVLSAISSENEEEIKDGISHDYFQAIYALHRTISENLIIAGELIDVSDKSIKLPGACCGIFQDPQDEKDEGRLFFLTTQKLNVDRIWYPYMKRKAKVFVSILLKRRRLIRAVVDARFPKTISWLKSIGFAEVKSDNVTVAEYVVTEELLF